MSVFRGDYMGFTYNGVHSSALGIVRVSDGSRFNENLLPTMQDKTVQVPGGDGTYYFGSYFTQRQIPVSFAFDGLVEEQIAQMKQLFGDKKIHELVFDEMPYKTYHAKVTGTATLKYISFNEGAGKERVYKGEGSIQFTCYEPYAVCKKKWLDLYADSNKEEWKMASGLKPFQADYDKINDNKIKLYNPGDIESDFVLKINFHDGKIISSKMTVGSYSIRWDEIPQQGSDYGVIFNSKINLLEGYDSKGRKTGTLYNKFITEGDFFKIPQGESELVFDKTSGDIAFQDIEYYYYYL